MTSYAINEYYTTKALLFINISLPFSLPLLPPFLSPIPARFTTLADIVDTLTLLQVNGGLEDLLYLPVGERKNTA